MNLDAINADPQLMHTPIGRVRLRRLGDTIGVCVDDGIRRERCIHHLDARGLHAAFHGKAFNLRAAVLDLWRRQHAAEMAVLAAEKAEIDRARAEHFLHFLKRDDARQALANVFGRPRVAQ